MNASVGLAAQTEAICFISSFLSLFSSAICQRYFSAMNNDVLLFRRTLYSSIATACMVQAVGGVLSYGADASPASFQSIVCTFQGGIYSLGLFSTLFIGLLALFFVFRIHADPNFVHKPVEDYPTTIRFAWGFSVGLVILFAALGYYSRGIAWCHLAETSSASLVRWLVPNLLDLLLIAGCVYVFRLVYKTAQRLARIQQGRLDGLDADADAIAAELGEEFESDDEDGRQPDVDILSDDDLSDDEFLERSTTTAVRGRRRDRRRQKAYELSEAERAIAPRLSKAEILQECFAILLLVAAIAFCCFFNVLFEMELTNPRGSSMVPLQQSGYAILYASLPNLTGFALLLVSAFVGTVFAPNRVVPRIVLKAASQMTREDVQEMAD